MDSYGAEEQGTLSTVECGANIYPILSLQTVLQLAPTSYKAGLRSFTMNGKKNDVRGKSPRNHFGRLSHLMDKAVFDHREFHIVSMDASKACPSVSRAQVKSLLVAEGSPEHLFDTVESVYEQGGLRVRYRGSEVIDEKFRVRTGIHQGCPLSILSFNVLLAPLCRKLKALNLPFGIILADDVSFAADSESQLQQVLALTQNHL